MVNQTIPPGLAVEKGTRIDVTVSKGPETPGTGEPGPREPPLSVSKPRISCAPDESYQGSNPRERRYLLTITGTGNRKGQKIQVVKQDEAGGRKVEFDGEVDPGMSRKLSIIGQGNTDIKVYHEGELADEFAFTVPAAPLPPDKAGPP